MWEVVKMQGGNLIHLQTFSDVVEADKWIRQNYSGIVCLGENLDYTKITYQISNASPQYQILIIKRNIHET